MIKTNRIAAAVAAAAMLTLAPMTTANAEAPIRQGKFWGCIAEDGPAPCVWDGKHMGNGQGRSVLILKGDDPRVKRIPHWVAHRLLHP